MGEPAAMELRSLAHDFFDTCRRRTSGDSPDPRFVPVGAGHEGVAQGLDRLESQARSAVWNMQRLMTFQLKARYSEMDARTLDRGLHVRLLTTPETFANNPSLSSVYPYGYTAPVFGPLQIVDGMCAVVPGAHDLEGRFTAWSTTDTAIVDGALELWERTFDLAKPVIGRGEKAPFSMRQVTVAQLLAQGLSDRMIASRVGVSERTIAGDVSRIVELLGGTNRTSAAALIAGTISPG
jgi:DNA-binding CsgD family transcriptional regulator